MTRTKEEQPVAVPLVKQTGAEALRQRWAWTKPWVWTERMLTALVNGVKEGQNAFLSNLKLFSLKATHDLACQPSSR